MLSKNELTSLKPQISGWAIREEKSLHKSFSFKNFKEAWEFMGLVAKMADQKDHHPEWTNVYNRVDVTLTTHSEGGITKKDIQLAAFMNSTETMVKLEHDE